MSEIKITYETLFDLLRREKSREELQKLDVEFYKEVQAYLHEKQTILQDTSSQAALFASSEKEKIRIQFQNIKKLLKELYERREKKVLYMALTKSRTNSGLMDTSAFLEPETQLFQELTQLLNRYRDYTLQPLLDMALPHSNVVLTPSLTINPVEAEIELPAPVAEPEAAQTTVTKAPVAHVTLRFKDAVPRFLGTELEIYGPYQPNDTAELPTEIAQILVQKGRAEEIK